jgi:hypothetical protein
VNAAVQAKQVAVAPAGPTVVAAPAQRWAQVVAPAFDPPLVGGGQFCTSCGQVPTPCLLVRSTFAGVGVRLPARCARSKNRRGPSSARCGRGQHPFLCPPRLPDSTAATAAPGAS